MLWNPLFFTHLILIGVLHLPPQGHQGHLARCNFAHLPHDPTPSSGPQAAAYGAERSSAVSVSAAAAAAAAPEAAADGAANMQGEARLEELLRPDR